MKAKLTSFLKNVITQQLTSANLLGYQTPLLHHVTCRSLQVTTGKILTMMFIPFHFIFSQLQETRHRC